MVGDAVVAGEIVVLERRRGRGCGAPQLLLKRVDGCCHLAHAVLVVLEVASDVGDGSAADDGRLGVAGAGVAVEWCMSLP